MTDFKTAARIGETAGGAQGLARPRAAPLVRPPLYPGLQAQNAEDPEDARVSWRRQASL